MTYTCLTCGQDLLKAKTGLVHVATSTSIVKRCKTCGYVGRDSVHCPCCQSKRYIVDHVATAKPVYAEGGDSHA